ncbi:MAG: phosphodiester glycosidase family protein [Alphaproteobacteria bacterium]
MKIIYFTLFALLFSTNLIANNTMLMQLQQEKQILSSENQRLKTKNSELIKLRDKLKKQKKGWGVATAITGTTALVSTGLAIKNYSDKKKAKLEIDDKVKKIKKDLELKVPFSIGDSITFNSGNLVVTKTGGGDINIIGTYKFIGGDANEFTFCQTTSFTFSSAFTEGQLKSATDSRFSKYIGYYFDVPNGQNLTSPNCFALSKTKNSPPIAGITPISGTGYKGFKITGKNIKIGKSNGSWTGDLWINGALFDGSGNIVGGYIDANNTKGWVDPTPIGNNFEWENGVIGQKNDGTFFIYKYANIPNSLTNVRWAFQNGMILRKGGNNHIATSKPEVAKRSALGWNSANEIVVVFTTNAIAVEDFPPLLASIGIDNAIYLDGAKTGYEDKNGNGWGTIKKAWSNADRIIFY